MACLVSHFRRGSTSNFIAFANLVLLTFAHWWFTFLQNHELKWHCSFPSIPRISFVPHTLTRPSGVLLFNSTKMCAWEGPKGFDVQILVWPVLNKKDNPKFQLCFGQPSWCLIHLYVTVSACLSATTDLNFKLQSLVFLHCWVGKAHFGFLLFCIPFLSFQPTTKSHDTCSMGILKFLGLAVFVNVKWAVDVPITFCHASSAYALVLWNFNVRWCFGY